MAHPVELREGLARLSAEQLQRIFEAYYRNAKRWETFPDTREKQVDEACRDVFGLGVEAALAKAPGQLRLLVHRVLDPTTKAKTISAPDLADVIIEEAVRFFFSNSSFLLSWARISSTLPPTPLRPFPEMFERNLAFFTNSLGSIDIPTSG